MPGAENERLEVAEPTQYDSSTSPAQLCPRGGAVLYHADGQADARCSPGGHVDDAVTDEECRIGGTSEALESFQHERRTRLQVLHPEVGPAAEDMVDEAFHLTCLEGSLYRFNGVVGNDRDSNAEAPQPLQDRLDTFEEPKRLGCLHLVVGQACAYGLVERFGAASASMFRDPLVRLRPQRVRALSGSLPYLQGEVVVSVDVQDTLVDFPLCLGLLEQPTERAFEIRQQDIDAKLARVQDDPQVIGYRSNPDPGHWHPHRSDANREAQAWIAVAPRDRERFAPKRTRRRIRAARSLNTVNHIPRIDADAIVETASGFHERFTVLPDAGCD
jgi:hypothetical protein